MIYILKVMQNSIGRKITLHKVLTKNNKNDEDLRESKTSTTED